MAAAELLSVTHRTQKSIEVKGLLTTVVTGSALGKHRSVQSKYVQSMTTLQQLVDCTGQLEGALGLGQRLNTLTRCQLVLTRTQHSVRVLASNLKFFPKPIILLANQGNNGLCMHQRL